MASVAVYGGYAHADNEVNLVMVDYRTRYSPRNRSLTQTRTMQISGELIYTDTSTIVQHANEVFNAYTDGKDFTYTVGGVLAHELRNTGECLSGVRVVNKSFPSGGPEQLATTRTFSVTLQGVYSASEDDLVSWDESVEVRGTGGPIWVASNTIYGAYIEPISSASLLTYSQTGSAVGFSSYPQPSPPIFSPFEYTHRRSIRRSSGTQQGTGIKFFRTTWHYEFPALPGSYNELPTSK